MADFLKNKCTNLGENWIKGQMGTNESKPASVPNNDKQRVDKGFTDVTSDGPWVMDAAKSGTGGSVKAWGKIDKADTEKDYIVNAAK